MTHAKLGKSDNLSLSIREIILDLPAKRYVISKTVRTAAKQYLQGAGVGVGVREGEKNRLFPVSTSLSFPHG